MRHLISGIKKSVPQRVAFSVLEKKIISGSMVRAPVDRVRRFTLIAARNMAVENQGAR